MSSLLRISVVFLSVMLGRELSDTYWSGYVVGIAVAAFLELTRIKKDEV